MTYAFRLSYVVCLSSAGEKKTVKIMITLLLIGLNRFIKDSIPAYNNNISLGVKQVKLYETFKTANVQLYSCFFSAYGCLLISGSEVSAEFADKRILLSTVRAVA